MFHASLPAPLVWILRLLAIAACGMSAYLLYVSASMTPVAGCDWDLFDCDAALASRWAKWFGLPVAAAGLACYGLTLIASWLLGSLSPNRSDTGWRLLEMLVPAMIGAGVWFIGVQAVMLDSFCLYCLLTHLCGIVIALLVVFLRWNAGRNTTSAPAAVSPLGIGALGVGSPPTVLSSGPPRLGLPTAAGVLSVLALIGGQLIASNPPPPAQSVVEADALPEDLHFGEPLSTSASDSLTDEATSSVEVNDASPSVLRPAAPKRKKNGSRIVEFLDGRLKVDTYKHPILGSPEAPHVVMELMDYACPHCREFHEMLLEGIDRFDGQIAVVVMPVPSELLCNPYFRHARPKSRGACRIAKVSLAMAMLAPESFEEVHHWLLQGDRMPQYTAALIEAQRFVDNDKLSAAVRDAEGDIDARIQQNIQLMVTLRDFGQIGLPTQVLADRVLSGPSESIEALCELWTEVYKVHPEGSEPEEGEPEEGAAPRRTEKSTP